MAGNSSSCARTTQAVSNGAWQGDSPLDFALPLLILQICIVLLVTRALARLLKPFRQPRVIAEIIGGILLGPSALGRIPTYKNNVFPQSSLTVLDTIANMGLMFFLFLVGLELDLKALRKTGKPALSIAAAGISVPFVASIGVTVVLHSTIASQSRFAPLLVFMGVAMSITAFPVLARILAERKLLMLDVGQMAMSAAAVNDVMAWILLALAVAISGSGKSPLVAVWVLLCGVAFLIVMFFVVRPMMAAMARKTVESEPVNELHVALTLAGVLIAGFATDAIGIHVIFGAFVAGLIVPKEGPLAATLVEKIEDIVTILMLPLYFASSGLKTDIGAIHGAQSVGLLVLVIAIACAGKILGTFAVAYCYRMGARKSLTLGFLMNTKGLVELIVLNIGKEKKVLNDETFAIMVLMALFTTFITTPVVMALYKPARDPKPYETSQRMLCASGMKPDGELRVVACVHGTPSIHAIINLVEASRGTRKRPLHMYVLHLLRLTERPSSIMRVQQVGQDGLPCGGHHDIMDSTALVFETYGQLSKVKVQVLTAVSSFDDMDKEVCNVSADRRAAFIILPYHKHSWSEDGVWECHSPDMEDINRRVLLHAPCSVGVLVDRGMGSMSSSLSSSHSVEYNVAVLFFGGPDDRESLAFACRMAEHPQLKVKVFHFVYGGGGACRGEDHVSITVPRDAGAHGVVYPTVTEDRTCDVLSASTLDFVYERKLDEECLTRCRSGFAVEYEEREADSHSVEAAAVEIGEMEGFNLLIMGRGRKPLPSFTAESAEEPVHDTQLGSLADMIITNCSGTRSSLLVIQQYSPDSGTDQLQPPKHAKS